MKVKFLVKTIRLARSMAEASSDCVANKSSPQLTKSKANWIENESSETKAIIGNYQKQSAPEKKMMMMAGPNSPRCKFIKTLDAGLIK